MTLHNAGHGSQRFSFDRSESDLNCPPELCQGKRGKLGCRKIGNVRLVDNLDRETLNAGFRRCLAQRLFQSRINPPSFAFSDTTGFVFVNVCMLNFS